MTTWTSVDVALPPVSTNWLDPLESPWVLATDGKEMFVAHFRLWPETEAWEGDAGWEVWGPDGYDHEVTHWMPLPPLPGEDS